MWHSRSRIQIREGEAEHIRETEKRENSGSKEQGEERECNCTVICASTRVRPQAANGDASTHAAEDGLRTRGIARESGRRLCLQFEPSDVEECAQGKIPPLLAGITHSQQRKWSSLLRRERELASCRMREEGRLLFVSGFNCANMIKECQKEKRREEQRPLSNANGRIGWKWRGKCRDT